MRWGIALAVLLIAAPAAAQTRYDQCLREARCHARVVQEIQAAVDAYKATLPCQTFAYADDGPTLGAERACIVIENVQPCGDNFCGTWPDRPEGE